MCVCHLSLNITWLDLTWLDKYFLRNVWRTGPVCIQQPWSTAWQWAKLWRSGTMLWGVLLSSTSYSTNSAPRLDNDCLRSLIHAFITSRLDYYNGLYSTPDAARLDILQRLLHAQNCVARYIFNAPSRSPSLYSTNYIDSLSIVGYDSNSVAWCTESTATLLFHTCLNCVFPVVIVIFDRPR